MGETELTHESLVRDLWRLHASLVESSERLSRGVEARNDLLDDEDYGRIRGRQHAFEDIARDLRLVLDAYDARDPDGDAPADGMVADLDDAARPILRLLRRSAEVSRPEAWVDDDAERERNA